MINVVVVVVDGVRVIFDVVVFVVDVGSGVFRSVMAQIGLVVGSRKRRCSTCK